MVKTDNCCGNFIKWLIGTFLLELLQPIWMFLNIFGLWQVGNDVNNNILEAFAPSGMDVSYYTTMMYGVTPCNDNCKF